MIFGHCSSEGPVKLAHSPPERREVLRRCKCPAREIRTFPCRSVLLVSGVARSSGGTACVTLSIRTVEDISSANEAVIQFMVVDWEASHGDEG